MARGEHTDDWRYKVGTILIAAAVVFFVSAWMNPLPDTASSAYTSVYYGGGLVTLGVGWWLRTRFDRD